VRTASSSSSEGDDSSDCSMGLGLPLVLYVHGGPWSRDTWGADPVVQLLTNRGYAVLQVCSGTMDVTAET
jgi:dipeptidyl aminopeptidase/acylaminoacyl peptidase